MPLKMLQLEALLRRLPVDHNKRSNITEDLRKSKAGIKGERSLDYYLTDLPLTNTYVLYDLRLPNTTGHFFQIDVLIITNYYLLILEVKNIAGTLFFDQTFNQLIRTKNGEEE